MNTVHPVLWHEGMLLTPQHFQQADRWQQAQLAQIVRSLSGDRYGIGQLIIDHHALASGTFALTAGDGIFPDGTPFSALTAEDLPEARAIAEHLKDGETRLAVYLALPLAPAHGTSCTPSGRHEGRHTRFRTRAALVIDSSEGGREREIALAIPNLRLLFGDEIRDGHSCLRIADLIRTGGGGFAIADDRVPPCLRLGAYPALLDRVRRVSEMLIGRSTELALQRRSRTQGLVEFSVSEAASFLTLHTLNGHVPRLLHIVQRGDQHPEAVFLQLATLAGELLTLADEGQPQDLPRYQHDELLACFSAMEERLRGLLQVITPQRYQPIPLSAQTDRVQSGILPETVLTNARIYLAVVSNLPAERALREIPQKSKVASAGRIAALTTQALPGIRLIYLAVPPSEIPAQPGGTYFELDRSSPEWAIAQKTRSLALYMPPELVEARAEFLAVQE